MKLNRFLDRRLLHHVRISLVFVLCWMLASLAGSAIQAKEPPSVRQALKILGYQVVEPGTPNGSTEKPTVQIAIPRTTQLPVGSSTIGTPDVSTEKPTVQIAIPCKTPLRVVSSTIVTTRDRDANNGDPWIEWKLEGRYGESPAFPRNVEYEVRISLLLFDETRNVYFKVENNITDHNREGQPTSFGFSSGRSLDSVKSGVAVLVVLAQESPLEPWELISYRTTLLEGLERASVK